MIKMSDESKFAESEITPFENFDDSSNMSERKDVHISIDRCR